MDVAADNTEYAASEVEAGAVHARDIYGACLCHCAIGALTSFNEHLAGRALEPDELQLFLASMAAFNRHTIGGIAILAGRVSDEALPRSPLTAHDIGALILDAAVDEYGLRESPNHLRLARTFADYLRVSPASVEARKNASGSSLVLGDALFSWYRDAPTAFALGVHTASEVTSVKEFFAWHDVFLKFPQYRFSLQSPEFEYLRAHCAHEPGHINNARKCLALYLDVFPGRESMVREGAAVYLDHYQRMFHELDTLIFK